MDSDKLYKNFHDSEKEGIRITDDLDSTRVIPSFIKIDFTNLKNLTLSEIKSILDTYAKLIQIYPFTRYLLTELKTQLDGSKSFLIENKEVYIWKGTNTNLFLIPKNSPSLRSAKVIIKDSIEITWNSRSKSFSNQFTVGFLTDGLKIYKNNMSKTVSEIFREREIPVPIREKIPILFLKEKPCAILFSLWDDNIADFYGSLFYEAK